MSGDRWKRGKTLNPIESIGGVNSTFKTKGWVNLGFFFKSDVNWMLAR